jgi:outer membrane protein OmpA-like peptidoglycan-associated protein
MVMASLLDDLAAVISPRLIGAAAARLGEPEDTVSRSIHDASASVLAGLATRATDPDVARQLHGLVTDRANDERIVSDVDALVGAAPDTPASGLGQRVLALAFPTRADAVTGALARSTGLRTGAVSAILSIVSPLVLAVLGRRVRNGGLDAAGLGELLAGQREELLSAAPAGIGEILRGTRGAAHEPAAPRTRATEPELAHSPASRWAWPTLATVAVVAVVALLWGLSRRGERGPESAIAGRDVGRTVESPTSPLDTAARGVAGAAATAAGEVSGAVRDLGDDIRHRLPNGRELSVPARGIESRLLDFIEDEGRRVDDTTWFDFDRLTFETGAASLRPESEEQIQNIADILEAYPNVQMKIGGYTDNVGDPEANLKLSRERANAVKRALEQRGIAADRVDAEGYGEQYPVADNSTEAGRARNRRIALRVTEK